MFEYAPEAPERSGSLLCLKIRSGRLLFLLLFAQRMCAQAHRHARMHAHKCAHTRAHTHSHPPTHTHTMRIFEPNIIYMCSAHSLGRWWHSSIKSKPYIGGPLLKARREAGRGSSDVGWVAQIFGWVGVSFLLVGGSDVGWVSWLIFALFRHPLQLLTLVVQLRSHIGQQHVRVPWVVRLVHLQGGVGGGK